MKVLHFDCFAGISGDMTLGALVDLGVDPDELRGELNKLNIEGWSLDFTKDERSLITGTKAVVTIEDCRSDSAAHLHSAHTHWSEIKHLIARSALRASIQDRALAIFSRIAEAEAEVHGVPIDEVAFHEVGALDSIIDIVGTAICIDMLKPDKITSGEIELGGGFVQCAHGTLPVPAPATLKLCKGLPVKTGGFDKEMTTPTGAAILAVCVDQFVSASNFTEIKSAYGIGTRKMDKPNVLRVSWREENTTNSGLNKPYKNENLILIETNIDDMTGEAFGFLMEKLFERGALDVTFTPCTMKKSRPGTVVSVLCGNEKIGIIRNTLFQHSTTIGLREKEVNRISLPRESAVINLNADTANIKTAHLDGGKTRTKIEYEDRVRIASKRNISLNEAEEIIQHEIKKQGEDNWKQ